MNSPNLYEKPSLKNRFRELAVLALFTAAIAILSLLVMDALILPLSIFATGKSAVFTLIIKNVFFYGIILVLIALFIRKIIHLNRDGLSGAAVTKYLLQRPFHYLGLFFVFIFISSVIIFILYMLLSYNDLLIHRITGS